MDEARLHDLMRLPRTTTSKRSWRCPGLAIVAAYADGRLEGKPHLQFERHLAGCGHCLSELAFLLRTQESEKEIEVSPALLARARSLTETKTAFAWRPVWSWAALSAATALLALVVSFELREPRINPTLSMPTARVLALLPLAADATGNPPRTAPESRQSRSR